PHAPSKVLRYLVMEYVPGQDLEQYVAQHGPLPIAEACDYVSQAASGLRHAHEHGLVHRDMKPSNLLLTPQQQVKILDFGLARLCRRRCTEAHTMLGTVDYMAPEQARDARSADIRADIYGLGGTLYWLLTGQKPFPGDRAPVVELLARQHDAPPALRRGRPDAPPELEAVVARMMATNPDDRYPTPLAVMQALSRFREPAVAVMTGRGTVVRSSNLSDTEPDLVLPPEMLPPDAGQRARRALIVSARPACRLACRAALEPQHLECSEAGDPAELADALARCPCDLVLIDAELPGAADLCRRLRESPPVPHLKLLLLTAGRGGDIHAAAQEAGADDAICWIGPPQELQARARLAVRLKEVEDRADRLASHLLTTNRQLEEALKLRDADLYQAQDALIFAMAKMAESRGLETGGHLLRMQQYVRALAEEAQRLPAYVNLIDDSFVRMIERCVMLHDVGKVAIPDHVLLKPGRLDAEERSIMESHTVVGAGILEAVARHHGASLAFLHMAIDIARHHHKRWDGSGYPDGLAGEAIPLAARIVTVADVYDALRSKLVYKPGLPHGRAKRLILESAPGQFDPALLVAFRQCEATLEQIFAQTTD
ncbi:MAG TPA: HD domain-containing phosphohydrolase, partial [Gemmataceae bacterium]|nr:HD domain-containing phosphohydrolase [Gemmataceae bacterium]